MMWVKMISIVVVIFRNGKKLANTLKLRIAMRAYGAPGATFAQTAITEALAADLLRRGCYDGER